MKTGQALPVVAGRFLEQQSEELSVCDSQQQSAGRSQQQHRFSGCLSCREYSSVSELADGNLLGESEKSPDLLR